MRVAILAISLLVACKKDPPAPLPPSASASSSSAPAPVPIAASGPLPSASADDVGPAGAPAGTMSFRGVDGGTTTLGDVKGMEAWIKARAAARDLVRVPLVRHGSGWGCICPEYYLGTSSTTGTDYWISPKFEPTAPELAPDTVVIAEGYFTGKKEKFKSRSEGEYDKVTMNEFRVLRYRPNANEEEDRVMTIATGKETHLETPAPADGNGWLLVAASIPLDAKAPEAAEKKRAELAGKGFPNAEVIDSRRAPGLFCCYLVVVVSRHATEHDAQEAAKAAKSKTTVIVRRGW